MKYKSKIDFNRYLSLILVTILFVWNLSDVILHFSLFNVIFLIFWSFLMVSVLNNLFLTYYVLEEKELVVKSGKKELRLDYQNLALITDTSNVEVYSYFALSKDTLGLIYNTHVIIISPKDKEGFIKNLTTKLEASHQ